MAGTSTATPASAAVLGAALCALPALAEEDHVLEPEGAFDYTADPPAVPEGAEIAVVHGDPAADGLFAVRLRMPEDYFIPPHLHSGPEVVTVISGSLLVGVGEEPDRAAATEVTVGGVFAADAEHVHYAFAAEDGTVIQVTGTGPFTVTYADDADDPRIN
jgi:quercetin dioxygenase-like cupin family protein